jgi:hypothetical protein
MPVEDDFHGVFQTRDPQFAVQDREGLAQPPPASTREGQHKGCEQYNQQSLQTLWLPDGIFDRQPFQL